MAGVILGVLMFVLGGFCIVKGRLPFIKSYHGVKNIKLHSRIEGTAVLLIGIVLVLQCFMEIGTAGLVASVVIICALALILEMILKVI